jgi:hypothetical protein
VIALAWYGTLQNWWILKFNPRWRNQSSY